MLQNQHQINPNKYAEADFLILMNKEDTSDIFKCACVAFQKWQLAECFSIPSENIAIAVIEDRTSCLPFKEGVAVRCIGNHMFEDAEIGEDFIHVASTYEEAIKPYLQEGHESYYLVLLFTEDAELTPAQREEKESMLLGLGLVDVNPVYQYEFWAKFFECSLKDTEYNTAQQLIEMGRILRIARGVATQRAVFEGRCHSDYFSIDSVNPCWITLLDNAVDHRVRYAAAIDMKHTNYGRLRMKVQSTDPDGEDYSQLEEMYPLAGWTIEQGHRTMILEMPWDTRLKRINCNVYYDPLPENNSEVTKIIPKMSTELDVITKEEREKHEAVS